MSGLGPLTTREAADAIELVAGPVVVTLENGALRWIRVRDVEVVRGIYGAVRDPSWGTIQPRFATYQVASGGGRFEVRFSAECVREADGVDVGWSGTITGSRDGTIRFVFDGQVRRPFDTARIGLCVLHPPRLAGSRVVVETLFGTHRGHFPDLITGHMPFSNITQITHDLVRVHETRIDFAGDVFEMEDQRAFADASFKTFSRPLALPWPYRVDAGTPVRQAVTISVPRAGSAIARSTTVGMPRSDVVRLSVGAGRLFPAVGSSVPPPGTAMAPSVARAVRGLGLAHLRAEVVVSGRGASEQLDRAVDHSMAAGAALEVVLVVDPRSAGIGELVGRLAAHRGILARVIAVDLERHTTPPALAARVRAAMRSAGLSVPLVGGSRAYLYQLVAQGLPAELVDGVTYPANPQVHAFDESSIIETVEALPATVRTAAALAGGKPVAVGPVSLKALLNPDLVGPEPPPAPGGLPGRYDRRQPSAFAAAWTLGAAAALAGAGAASLTLHETAGWAGLVTAENPDLPPMPAQPGIVLPVGCVVAALVGLNGAEVLEGSPVTRLATLAVRRPAGRLEVLLANLDQAPRRVVVIPGRRGEIGTARLLTPTVDGSAAWQTTETLDGVVDLPGYGIAAFDGRFA